MHVVVRDAIHGPTRCIHRSFACFSVGTIAAVAARGGDNGGSGIKNVTGGRGDEVAREHPHKLDTRLAFCIRHHLDDEEHTHKATSE